jgi:hypothetical protein
LTDTDAYFNYLEHQSEQHHNETVAQRTQDYNRVLLAARRSMTPEMIKRLRLAKREKQEALRALTREERKRSDFKRNFLKRQVPGNNHKSSGGSILIQGMWIGKSGGRQWTSDAPRIRLLTLESISKTNELRTKETKREK